MFLRAAKFVLTWGSAAVLAISALAFLVSYRTAAPIPSKWSPGGHCVICRGNLFLWYFPLREANWFPVHLASPTILHISSETDVAGGGFFEGTIAYPKQSQ